MKKKTKLLIAIFSVLFAIIACFVGTIIYIKVNLDLSSDFKNGYICGVGIDEPCETTSFIVDEGAWGKSTIDKLYQTGILKDENIPYYYYRFLNPQTFYAGYYEIPHNLDLDGLIDYLSDEDNIIQDTVSITFYEDDFITDFAKKIADSTNLGYNAILEYWNDEEVIKSYMEEYPFLTDDIFDEDIKVLLEGYLAPDTYEFFSYTTYDEVTRVFLDQTLSIYNEFEEDFKNSDMSIHEIFTLASICQWESGDLEDMKMIAGVFLNKLNNRNGEGSYIRSSVTVCYAFDLDKDACKIVDTAEEEYVLKDHPYNTYLNPGLPPGPVLCPGKDAIDAALHPTDNNYFFFVGDLCYNTGTVFAKTYEQHLANVEKYVNGCFN